MDNLYKDHMDKVSVSYYIHLFDHIYTNYNDGYIPMNFWVFAFKVR
jgi:hypothetical protein